MNVIPNTPIENNEPVEFEPMIQRTGASTFIKWVVPFLILAAGSALAYWQIIGPKMANAAWINEFDRALEASKQSGKPVVALFTADWCPACQALESDALSRSDVASALKADFTPVKVDLTTQTGENARIAQTFGVHGIPTIIMFDVNGQQVDRFSGAMPGDDLLQWIASHKARATAK